MRGGLALSPPFEALFFKPVLDHKSVSGVPQSFFGHAMGHRRRLQYQTTTPSDAQLPFRIVFKIFLFPKQEHAILKNMAPPHDQHIADSALAGLQQVTGIEGQFRPSAQPHINGEVELRRGDTTVAFSAELKTTLRRGHLPGLLDSIKHLPQPSILLTHHVTEPVAQELAKRGVNFADAAGNAHIAHGAWFIFTAGRSAPASATPSTLTASTWKVAYAMLRNPELGSETVRELAAQAGVSPGATTKAIQALDERGWVSNHKHERLLVRPETLWRAWEGGWVDRLAAKLFITRATAPSHRTLLDWSDLARSVEHVLVGGEVAAQRRGTFIVSETATVHVREWNAATMAQLRLVPDDTGSITVRQRFGALDEDPDHPGLAHPMLVRADLLTVLDERLDGTRQQLAEHILRDLPDAP